MRRFTSTARRDGRWWVIQCDQEPAAISQVARLDQAASVHAEAIAMVTGLDEAEIEVEVTPALGAVEDKVKAFRELRAEAERISSQASIEARALVGELADQGLSVRDIGTVLGVSYQRAGQLAQERRKAWADA